MYQIKKIHILQLIVLCTTEFGFCPVCQKSALSYTPEFGFVPFILEFGVVLYIGIRLCLTHRTHCPTHSVLHTPAFGLILHTRIWLRPTHRNLALSYTPASGFVPHTRIWLCPIHRNLALSYTPEFSFVLHTGIVFVLHTSI